MTNKTTTPSPLLVVGLDRKVSPLPCPFCGMPADLEDRDTLYPSGTGWKFDEELQMRTYHRMQYVPPEQWCYGMHCRCGAEIHGDSKEEALAKWDKRANANQSIGDSMSNQKDAFEKWRYSLTSVQTNTFNPDGSGYPISRSALEFMAWQAAQTEMQKQLLERDAVIEQMRRACEKVVLLNGRESICIEVVMCREALKLTPSESLAKHDAEVAAKALEDQEPVAWTTMPEAYDWVFVSGAENPNGKLIGKFHPLYALPTTAMLDKARDDEREACALAVMDRGRDTKNGEWHGNNHAAEAFAKCIRERSTERRLK